MQLNCVVKPYNGRPIVSRIMVYPTVPLLNDLYLKFQGHAITWCSVSQKWYEIDIVSMEYLHMLYSYDDRKEVTEWLSKTFNDTKRRAVSATAEPLVFVYFAYLLGVLVVSVWLLVPV